MLQSLHIENVAVIERADIEFSPGLTVLTGETGAGKSIVIDSIQAVLGARTTRELVRSGEEKAVVAACFDAAPALEWCRENEIDCDDGTLILQRRISSDGKTSARVNGVPVAAAQLRELGALLLDLHGQNDGRQLMDERRHLAYLDRFGETESEYQAFREQYERYAALRKEIKSLQMDEGEKERLAEQLTARIAELEKAELRLGEEEKLIARRDLLRNGEKLTEQLDAAYEALYAGDENAISLCRNAAYALSRAAAWCPDLTECTKLLDAVSAELEDAAERVRDQSALLDFSPEEYDRLEERLSLLRRLQRKYMCDEAGLIALLDASREKLNQLEYAGERLEKLRRELDISLRDTRLAAKKLTEKRREAGERLRERVEKELRELSMPSVRFETRLEAIDNASGFDASGADSVRFLMSANAGEALGPISRIASGGELSRIMLALKSVFAERDSVPTQIFDEIDTGVSGIAAQRVGEKLAKLGRGRQVLCVTHLPQIAALADTQLLVRKSERGGRTYTELRELDRAGRREELARLHGGESITELSLASAEEQLTGAEKYKKSLSEA